MRLSVAATTSKVSVRVDWTAATDATGYVVQWNTANSGWDSPTGTTTIASGSTTTYTIHSLSPNTTYYVRLITTRSGASDTNRADDSRPSAVADTRGGVTVVDYDDDDDGLIEVTSLAQLNAIRWDLDGNGTSTDAGYATAFPNAEPNMGCNENVVTIASGPGNPACSGYELRANLDFDTGTKGDRTDDTYYDSGAGWTPIGDATTAYAATFEGNGNTISNLYVNASITTEDDKPDVFGLFGMIGTGGAVRNLGLPKVSISAVSSGNTGEDEVWAGALAGDSVGTVTGVWSSGSVTVEISADYIDTYAFAGGIVGRNDTGGVIRASYSHADATVKGVTSTNLSNGTQGHAGGLVARNKGAISASYATGDVRAEGSGASAPTHAYTGGLAGRNSGSITASYASGDLNATAANVVTGGLAGENKDSGSVTASFATGKHTTATDTSPESGGLAGKGTANVTNSYWDTTNSGITATGAGTGKTTSELQTPSGYNGIYASWDVNVDGTAGNDDPWDFGATNEYPVLKFGGLQPASQRNEATLAATPASIWESNKGGATRATTTSITASLKGDTTWHDDVTVALATTTAFTLTANGSAASNVTVPAGSNSGATTLAAVNNQNCGAGACGVTQPSDNAHNWSNLTTGDPWVTIASSSLSLTIRDDDLMAQVTGVAASDGGTSARVNWDKVTNAAGYVVQWRDDSQSDYAASDMRAVTLPAKPTSLSASAGDGQAVLTWQNPANSDVTGYQFRYKLASASDYGHWSNMAGSGATTVTYTLTGLLGGSAYNVQIRAVTDAGPGPVSDAATVTPTGSNTQPPSHPNDGAPGPTAVITGLELGDTYAFRVYATKSGYDDGVVSAEATTTLIARILLSKATIDVPEAGTSTYTVRLNANPSQNVTVAITRKTGSHASRPTISTASLTFTPANGANPGTTPQTVSLSTASDTDALTESTTFVHTASSGDALFSGITAEIQATAQDSNKKPTSADFTAELRALYGRALFTNIPFTSFNFADTDTPPDTFKRVIIETLPPASYGELKIRVQRTDGPCRRRPNSTFCWSLTMVAAGQEENPSNPNRKLRFYPTTNFVIASTTSFTFRVKDSSDHVSENAYTATLTPQGNLPSRPTGLTATAGDAQVTLTWNNPNNSAITRYEYLSYVTGAFDYAVWKSVPNSGATTVTYTVTGLENGQSYGFKLRAVNSSGSGLGTGNVEATPLGVAKTAGLVATLGSGHVTLSWTDPSDSDVSSYDYQQRRPFSGQLGHVRWRTPSNASNITKYQYRTKHGANAWTDWQDICAQANDSTCKNTTSHHVRGVDVGKRYDVQVRYLVGATPTPVRLASHAARLTSTSGGNVTLEWDAPSQDADLLALDPVDKYQYQYQTNGAWPQNWTDVPCDSTCDVATQRSFVITSGLTASTQYVFRVRAYRASPGETESVGVYSETDWYRLASGETWLKDWKAISGSGANTTSTRVTGLTLGTTYDFRVRARSSVAPGPPSDSVRVPYALPAQPTGLRAATGVGRATLSWNNPRDARITGYQYQLATTTGSWPQTWTDVPSSGATTTGYTVQSLTNNTEYSFRIRAVNRAGNSATSSVATTTPNAPPAKPTGLKGRETTRTAILTWDAPSPADSIITKWQYQLKTGTNWGNAWADLPCVSPCSAPTQTTASVTLRPDQRNSL